LTIFYYGIILKPAIQSCLISPSPPPSPSCSDVPLPLLLPEYPQIYPYDTDTESQDDSIALNSLEDAFEISDSDNTAESDELDDPPSSLEALYTILSKAQAKLSDIQ
jgi:hypothetical protein